jgi:hypothetical protein
VDAGRLDRQCRATERRPREPRHDADAAFQLFRQIDRLAEIRIDVVHVDDDRPLCAVQ